MWIEYKNNMRLSGQKTPLAKLRAMLKKEIQVPKQGKKCAGQFETKLVRLSRDDVAGWLDCGVDNISSIESGRVKLTEENAEIIELQTGASSKWLVGKDSSPVPISFFGSRYQQKHFDRAQAGIKRTGYPVLRAQAEFKAGVAALATILLHACKRGEIDACASKLWASFRDFFVMFPKSEPFVDFGKFIDQSIVKLETPDFKPLLDEWEKQLICIAAQRQQSKPAKPTRR